MIETGICAACRSSVGACGGVYPRVVSSTLGTKMPVIRQRKKGWREQYLLLAVAF
jgi:hypothetical protein